MTAERGITIRQPDDWHLHLRDGELLKRVLPFTAKVFGRGLVMPNLTPPILSGSMARQYSDRIMEHIHGGDLREMWKPGFCPLMTIKVRPDTTAEMIFAAKKAVVIAGKVYPAGVTTNSEDGWTDIGDLAEPFGAMEECGMVLCLHGETPGEPSLNRETHFAENYLIPIAEKYPRLKIVFEHVTTRTGCRIVRTLPNVAGTITVHHLLITLDDIIGSNLNSHCFCKPVAKTEDDRQALIEAATSGAYSFFLGTDSAPHTRHGKHSGSAGCFTAPVAMELLAQVFDEEGALDKLETFASVRGAEFYGLPLNEGKIRLVRKSSKVPQSFSWNDDGSNCSEGYENTDDLIPFWADREIQWEVAEVIHAEQETAPTR